MSKDNRYPSDRRFASALYRAWTRLGIDRAAVRSSGLNEDSSDKSFAGIFDSVLNVTKSDALDAIASVRDSFQHKLTSYTQSSETGGIIVQKMVPAEWAGVLFTRHPREAGLALIEMVPGLGDSLVCGSTTPKSFRLSRITGRLMDDAHPPIDLSVLHALGLKAEKIFGKPQDIEWAYTAGRFYILQSRDITRVSSEGPLAGLEAERNRLLEVFRDARPGEIVLAQAEISELVPRPTPATLSLMESLWQPGAATDHACRALGLSYAAEEDGAPYLVSVFGNLYLNKIEASCRIPPLTPWVVARITRSAGQIERHLTEEFTPSFLREAAVLEAVDANRLDLKGLFGLFEEVRERFVTRTYAEAFKITLVASVLLNKARRDLEERNLNPANVLGDMPETPMSQAISALAATPREQRKLSDFLSVFGHRAPLDYELSCPRYSEDPKLAEFTMANMLAVDRPKKRQAHPIDMQDRRSRALSHTIIRARQFQALKEQAKHHCLRELAIIRRLLVAIGQRLHLDQGIFQLTLDEISRMKDPDFQEEAAAIIARRRSSAELFKHLRNLPSELSIETLETLRLDSGAPHGESGTNSLKGTLVAGYGPVDGRARIISVEDNATSFDASTLGEDAIIVSRLVHPHWLTWLARTRGVVCQVGGWLSHTAILAREYNLPMIIGVQGLDCIKDGDPIRLHADGRVELLQTVERQLTDELDRAIA